DFAYFGMIGSKTKRVKFERRLIERGVAPERLHEMVCPIGVTGIVDKAPASIAVAVCAQLMQVSAREAGTARRAPSIPTFFPALA
ncbi:MAG TPA: XdhC family protein, partial [Trinickia sp.]|nr:XdhC family protein [Trinickia sp.]